MAKPKKFKARHHRTSDVLRCRRLRELLSIVRGWHDQSDEELALSHADRRLGFRDEEAEMATLRLVIALLRCEWLQAVADDEVPPSSTRGADDHAFVRRCCRRACPCYALTPLTESQQQKLARLQKQDVPVRHVVLHHEYLTEQHRPSDVWRSLDRLMLRFGDFRRSVDDESQLTLWGGYFRTESDRARRGDTRGILIHQHLMVETLNDIDESLYDTLAPCWEAAAENDEDFDCRIVKPAKGRAETVRDLNDHRYVGYDIDNLFHYLQGVRRRDKGRHALHKILDGTRRPRAAPYDEYELKQWDAKGPLSAEQLHLLLACFAYNRKRTADWFKNWRRY